MQELQHTTYAESWITIFETALEMAMRGRWAKDVRPIYFEECRNAGISPEDAATILFHIRLLRTGTPVEIRDHARDILRSLLRIARTRVASAQ
jgi:hypothetical protein